MTQRHAIGAAIVDLDGTLVDTLGDFDAALSAMLRELGRPPLARATIARLIGKGSEHLIRRTLECTQADPRAVPDGLFEVAWRHYQQAYGSINGRYSAVYPGVEEGLRLLRQRGLVLACLTNKPRVHARTLLEAKRLDGYFAHVFGGDSYPRKKPDPLPLLETCRVLGSPPASTLMIGDSGNDAAAARAAGCPVVLMTYGYNHGEPVTSVDADGYWDSLAELARQWPYA